MVNSYLEWAFDKFEKSGEKNFKEFLKNLKNESFARKYFERVEFRAKLLEEWEFDDRFKFLNMFEFYRYVYGNNLQKRQNSKDNKFNVILSIMSYVKKKDEKNSKFYCGKQFMVKDDFQIFNYVQNRFEEQFKQIELLNLEITELIKWKNRDFVIISPCGYLGKKKDLRKARVCYEIVIDVDYIHDEFMFNFNKAIENEVLPQPTLIVNSGTGIHLHYVFNEPINIELRQNLETLNDIKKVLMSGWWSKYFIKEGVKIQYNNIFQSFRMVGTFTKDAGQTLGFKFKEGKKYSKDDLLEWQIKYKTCRNRKAFEWKFSEKVNLEKAKELYPKWTQNLENRTKFKKESKEEKKSCELLFTENKRERIYKWWLRKLHELEEVSEGHRYYCIYALAVFAKKCNIDYLRLRNDAYDLKPIFNKIGHEFTNEDIEAALKMYCYENARILTAKHLSEVTGVKFKKKKAPQGLTRQQALERANLALKHKRERQALERANLAIQKAQCEANLKFAVLEKKPKRNQKQRAITRRRREAKRQRILSYKKALALML